MLSSADHVHQAERVESLLKIVRAQAPQYKEWIIVLWFYVCLHYVDAFLSTKTSDSSGGHTGRMYRMTRYPETQAIESAYHRLYKLSREARYDGTPFTDNDLAQIEPLYNKVRQAMRTALQLPG